MQGDFYRTVHQDENGQGKGVSQSAIREWRLSSGTPLAQTPDSGRALESYTRTSVAKDENRKAGTLFCLVPEVRLPNPYWFILLS